MWKIALLLRIQKKIHPWISTTLKRKMDYSSYDKIFKSYRSKNVFSKINNNRFKNHFMIGTGTNALNENIDLMKTWIRIRSAILY